MSYRQSIRTHQRSCHRLEQHRGRRRYAAGHGKENRINLSNRDLGTRSKNDIRGCCDKVHTTFRERHSDGGRNVQPDRGLHIRAGRAENSCHTNIDCKRKRNLQNPDPSDGFADAEIKLPSASGRIESTEGILRGSGRKLRTIGVSLHVHSARALSMFCMLCVTRVSTPGS